MADLEIRDLSYNYPNSESPSLCKINLNIKSGDFVLILGNSGCGKTSLLRACMRLIPDFHGGHIKGDVLLNGLSLYNMNRKDLTSHIGFIFQNPENQIIFSDTSKEIVFGMENLNFSYDKMKINLADVASYLDIVHLIDKKTMELSGGEKQKIAIASILCMMPEIMLLDEPTSQLDAISAENIINTIRRLNEDFGISVLMVEHRLDKCFHIADRIILMDNGSILLDKSPDDFLDMDFELIQNYIPIVSRIFKKSKFYNYNKYSIPKTVKEGRIILKAVLNKDNKHNKSLNLENNINSSNSLNNNTA
ncbi:MAG: energy-coupling factor ABC transporter ATP-binding protein, partial [Spirochaetota bacterium]